MPQEPKQSRSKGRICPVCKGTGLDKTSHRRYTTGGHDDRTCPRCNGECYVDADSEPTDSSGESLG